MKNHFLDDEAASSQGSETGEHNHIKAKEADYYKDEELARKNKTVGHVINSIYAKEIKKI